MAVQKTSMTNPAGSKRLKKGFTLIEVMVAMTIGLVLMAGLLTTFAGAIRSQKEMTQDAEQIENGRVAIDILSQDIKLAGYYHTFYTMPPAPGSLPDPCSLGTNTGGVSADLLASTPLHVQVYTASSAAAKPDMTFAGGSTSCGGLLAASNLVNGSDVLLIRRASTAPLAASDAPVSNMPYLQSGAFGVEIQYGNSGAPIGATLRANGNLASAAPSMQIRDSTGALVAGEILRYKTHIYFVAPCSNGSASGGVCQSGDDTTPTLKRLELTSTSGATAFALNPLVEGVVSINFDIGVDNNPSAPSPSTGLPGDGEPDLFMRDGFNSQSMAIADWINVTSMNVFVLAQSIGSRQGPVDNKIYEMTDNTQTGAVYNLGPYNDQFRRHVYSARVIVENISQRRENP